MVLSPTQVSPSASVFSSALAVADVAVGVSLAPLSTARWLSRGGGTEKAGPKPKPSNKLPRDRPGMSAIGVCLWSYHASRGCPRVCWVYCFPSHAKSAKATAVHYSYGIRELQIAIPSLSRVAQITDSVLAVAPPGHKGYVRQNHTMVFCNVHCPVYHVQHCVACVSAAADGMDARMGTVDLTAPHSHTARVRQLVSRVLHGANARLVVKVPLRRIASTAYVSYTANDHVASVLLRRTLAFVRNTPNASGNCSSCFCCVAHGTH